MRNVYLLNDLGLLDIGECSHLQLCGYLAAHDNSL